MIIVPRDRRREPSFGWYRPFVVLDRRRAKRHDEIDHELPELIDLLVVSVEAGLSFPRSLRLAADGVRGPLGRSCG